MTKVYIVLDTTGLATVGNTLEDAYQNYEETLGDSPEFSDIKWFEAEEIKVQQKFIKVQKTILTKTK